MSIVRGLALGGLVVALALGGCGGSSRPSSSTSTKTATSAPPQIATIDVTIPDLQGGNLSSAHTCDGANVSAPVRWTGIPKSAAELAVVIVSFQPVDGQFFIDWAVGGLDPDLRGLAAGQLPPDAIVGRNSYGGVGYSICPSKGKRETYAVKVLALPRKLDLRTGFNAVAFYRLAERDALGEGFAGMTYTRR